jgi:hypothetical protein
MEMINALIKKKPLLFISIFLLAAGAIGAFSLIHRSHKPPSQVMAQPVAFPETFTFFSLGANTRLTEGFKKSFREILGPEGVSENTTMDLELHGRGFLSRHFETLHGLNQQLNSPPGERVEHRTIQLNYRYPVRERHIFHYVLILFSKNNFLPLLVETAAKAEGNSLLDNLKKKYGKPIIIDDPASPGKAYYWKQQNDYAIVSETPDHQGHPTYRMKIYFADNIRELIETEGLSDQNDPNTGEKGAKPLF